MNIKIIGNEEIPTRTRAGKWTNLIDTALEKMEQEGKDAAVISFETAKEALIAKLSMTYSANKKRCKLFLRLNDVYIQKV